jgi:hypothetical protein
MQGGGVAAFSRTAARSRVLRSVSDHALRADGIRLEVARTNRAPLHSRETSHGSIRRSISVPTLHGLSIYRSISVPTLHGLSIYRSISVPTLHSLSIYRSISVPTLHGLSIYRSISVPTLHSLSIYRSISVPTLHSSSIGRSISVPTLHSGSIRRSICVPKVAPYRSVESIRNQRRSTRRSTVPLATSRERRDAPAHVLAAPAMRDVAQGPR